MKKTIFLAAVMLIPILILVACSGKTEEKAVSYEIDPTKISTALAVEERLESFVLILNERTYDFSRVTSKVYDQEEKAVFYVLMVYGDANEAEFNKNFETVMKQLFAWTVKFVAPDIRTVIVHYILPDGQLGLGALEGENVTALKNSPPEEWKNFAVPIPLTVEVAIAEDSENK